MPGVFLFFVFYKKWANPASFSFYFKLFKHTLQFFTTNKYVRKCSSSIWCQDSNSRPLKHESPPITTSPGLPPQNGFFIFFAKTNSESPAVKTHTSSLSKSEILPCYSINRWQFINRFFTCGHISGIFFIHSFLFKNWTQWLI